MLISFLECFGEQPVVFIEKVFAKNGNETQKGQDAGLIH